MVKVNENGHDTTAAADMSDVVNPAAAPVAAQEIKVETYFCSYVKGFVYGRIQINNGIVVKHDIMNKSEGETYVAQAPDLSLVGKTKREVGLTRYGWRLHSKTTFVLSSGLPENLPIN